MATKNKKTSEVYEAEIVEEKPTHKKVTLKEIKFAQLLNQGMDPIEATKKVSRAGKMGVIQPQKQKAAVQKAANQLLKNCQEKMLIEVSNIAPKALKKMQALMYAKEPVYFNGKKIADKPSLETQRKAATKLIDMAMPKDQDRTPSLISQVIQINN